MSLAIQTLPRRILVRGVNWLGDAVMTTPAPVSYTHLTLPTIYSV